jgi:hypothetical protein
LRYPKQPHQTSQQAKDVSVSVLFGAGPVMVGQFNREKVTRSGLGTRTLRLLPHSVNEVYRRPLSVGVEVDYAYRPGADVVARVTFTSARSKGALRFTDYIDTRFPAFMSARTANGLPMRLIHFLESG